MMLAREWQVGTHRIAVYEPDLIRVDFEGPMEFEDARQLLAIYREVCSLRPRYFVADISRSSIDSATRKYLGTEICPEWFLGSIFINANLLLRILTNSLNSLIQFHRGSPVPMRYVADEAEASATLEAWRSRREQPTYSDPTY